METKKVLAVDLGASSGRVMLGSFDGEKITVEELHRFPMIPSSWGIPCIGIFSACFMKLSRG